MPTLSGCPPSSGWPSQGEAAGPEGSTQTSSEAWVPRLLRPDACVKSPGRAGATALLPFDPCQRGRVRVTATCPQRPHPGLGAAVPRPPMSTPAPFPHQLPNFEDSQAAVSSPGANPGVPLTRCGMGRSPTSLSLAEPSCLQRAALGSSRPAHRSRWPCERVLRCRGAEERNSGSPTSPGVQTGLHKREPLRS